MYRVRRGKPPVAEPNASMWPDFRVSATQPRADPGAPAVGRRISSQPSVPYSLSTKRGSCGNRKGNPVGALKEGGGPIVLPRPERDRRAVSQGDGTVAFKAAVMSFSPCESSAGAGTLELIIGSCASGECSPMRYRAPESAAIARLRLAEE